MRLQLLLDALLLHEAVPVELGLVEAAHLLLLPGDGAHDARDAARTLGGPDARRGGRVRVGVGLFLVLEELLGLFGILVHFFCNPGKKGRFKPSNS